MLSPTGREAQWGVEWLLVHLVPSGVRREGPELQGTAPIRSVWFTKVRLMRPWSSTVTSRWPGASTVHPTRFRASEGVHRGPHPEGARLPPHLLLRGLGLPAQGRRGHGASWCPGSDREGGRWCRGGVSAGHAGQEDSGSFLYNGTRSLFEQAGFSYERSKGKNHCVMRRTVSPVEEP
jgi:hypothetical protein